MTTVPVHPNSTVRSTIMQNNRVQSKISAPQIFYPAPAMPTDRRRDWITTIIITIVAGLSRFIGLGTITDKGTPVFDEKHYVPQGYQMLTNGHWTEDNPGYGLIVHPPVGKWLVATGEWLFGYTPFGWRFFSALLGTMCIFLIVRIARRLSRSIIVGAIAGVLAIVDGVMFISSRTALLDIFLTFFILTAISCILVDRDQVHTRLAYWSNSLPQTTTPLYARRYGPKLGFRWWRTESAVMLGLASGCKWSAAYFIFMIFFLSFYNDALARKKYGIYHPWIATVRRDLIWSISSLIILSIAVHMATWCFWFSNETAYDRFADVYHMDPARSVQPDHFIAGHHLITEHFPALQAWWYYQLDEVLHFHTTLTNKNVGVHPWESKPWTWPMGLRPVLYYYETSTKCVGCSGKILLVGTPTMWWLAFPILGICLWQSAIKRRWSYTVTLLCYLTAWLPWFSNTERQMYYFYAVPMAPFLFIAIALIIGDFIGATHKIPNSTWLIPEVRWIFAATYIAFTILCFLWLLPIFNGTPISPTGMNLRTWLPSWS